MIVEELLEKVQQLSSSALARLIEKRHAEDKALRTLWRAALLRERAERQSQQEAVRDGR